MKFFISFVFVLFTMVLGYSQSSKPLIDLIIENRIAEQQTQNFVFQQAIFGQVMIDQTLRKTGRDRINSGRASNAFLPKAENSYLYKLTEKLSAQEKTDFINSLKPFYEIYQIGMTRAGLKTNDVADGQAFAFWSAYFAYTGEDPENKRLIGLRNKYTRELISDEKFQGTPDYMRQPEHESRLIRATIAFYFRNKSLQNGIDAESKEKAISVAKSYSDSVLRQLWNAPSSTIELTAEGFGNRAERMVRDGTATTEFNRDPRKFYRPAFYHQNYSYRGKSLSYYENLVGEFEKEILKRGGKTNDLAWTAAVAFEICYSIAKSKSLNPQQFQWILDEMRNDILKTQGIEFQSLTDEQKQTWFEDYAIATMMILDDYKSAKKKLDSVSSGGSAHIRALAEAQIKVDLDQAINQAEAKMREIFLPRKFEDYVLTNSGFEKIR